MWQRARMINRENKVALGKLLWVQCGPPITKASHAIFTLKYLPPEPRFNTNIIPPDGTVGVVRKTAIELIAEFADEVPRVRWEDFINQ